MNICEKHSGLETKLDVMSNQVQEIHEDVKKLINNDIIRTHEENNKKDFKGKFIIPLLLSTISIGLSLVTTIVQKG